MLAVNSKYSILSAMSSDMYRDAYESSLVNEVVLDIVLAAAKNFPETDRKATELSSYDYLKMGDERYTTVVGLKLGMVALGTEELLGSSISYRFKFGDRGYVEYAAQSYDSSEKQLLGDPIVISGRHDVLGNDSAMQRLSVVGSKIISAAGQGWPTLKPQLNDFRALRYL